MAIGFQPYLVPMTPVVAGSMDTDPSHGRTMDLDMTLGSCSVQITMALVAAKVTQIIPATVWSLNTKMVSSD